MWVRRALPLPLLALLLALLALAAGAQALWNVTVSGDASAALVCSVDAAAGSGSGSLEDCVRAALDSSVAWVSAVASQPACVRVSFVRAGWYALPCASLWMHADPIATSGAPAQLVVVEALGTAAWRVGLAPELRDSTASASREQRALGGTVAAMGARSACVLVEAWRADAQLAPAVLASQCLSSAALAGASSASAGAQVLTVDGVTVGVPVMRRVTYDWAGRGTGGEHGTLLQTGAANLPPGREPASASWPSLAAEWRACTGAPGWLVTFRNGSTQAALLALGDGGRRTSGLTLDAGDVRLRDAACALDGIVVLGHDSGVVLTRVLSQHVRNAGSSNASVSVAPGAASSAVLCSWNTTSTAPAGQAPRRIVQVAALALRSGVHVAVARDSTGAVHACYAPAANGSVAREPSCVCTAVLADEAGADINGDGSVRTFVDLRALALADSLAVLELQLPAAASGRPYAPLAVVIRTCRLFFGQADVRSSFECFSVNVAPLSDASLPACAEVRFVRDMGRAEPTVCVAGARLACCTLLSAADACWDAVPVDVPVCADARRSVMGTDHIVAVPASSNATARANVTLASLWSGARVVLAVPDGTLRDDATAAGGASDVWLDESGPRRGVQLVLALFNASGFVSTTPFRAHSVLLDGVREGPPVPVAAESPSGDGMSPGECVHACTSGGARIAVAAAATASSDAAVSRVVVDAGGASVAARVTLDSNDSVALVACVDEPMLRAEFTVAAAVRDAAGAIVETMHVEQGTGCATVVLRSLARAVRRARAALELVPLPTRCGGAWMWACASALRAAHVSIEAGCPTSRTVALSFVDSGDRANASGRAPWQSQCSRAAGTAASAGSCSAVLVANTTAFRPVMRLLDGGAQVADLSGATLAVRVRNASTGIADAAATRALFANATTVSISVDAVSGGVCPADADAVCVFADGFVIFGPNSTNAVLISDSAPDSFVLDVLVLDGSSLCTLLVAANVSIQGRRMPRAQLAAIVTSVAVVMLLALAGTYLYFRRQRLLEISGETAAEADFVDVIDGDGDGEGGKDTLADRKIEPAGPK